MLSNTSIKIPALIAALSLAGCVETTTSQSSVIEAPEGAAAATTAAGTIEDTPLVSANFGGGSGNWDGFGSVIYRFTTVVQDNEVFICGAYTGRGSSDIRKLSREVMRQARITADGQTIMHNLRFFNEVSNSNFVTNLVGVETNCRSTGKSADEVSLNNIRIETRDGRYRV